MASSYIHSQLSSIRSYHFFSHTRRRKLRDCPKINCIVIEKKNGSDFDDVSVAGVPSYPRKETSSKGGSIFPPRTVQVISGQSPTATKHASLKGPFSWHTFFGNVVEDKENTWRANSHWSLRNFPIFLIERRGSGHQIFSSDFIFIPENDFLRH